MWSVSLITLLLFYEAQIQIEGSTINLRFYRVRLMSDDSEIEAQVHENLKTIIENSIFTASFALKFPKFVLKVSTYKFHPG